MPAATKRRPPEPTPRQLGAELGAIREQLAQLTAHITPPATDSKALLEAQARRNALRTFVQGLGIDVLVAAAILIAQLVSSPLEEWQGWAAVGIALGRTMLGAAASYVMRKFVDGSHIPTPLPIVPEATPVEVVDNDGEALDDAPDGGD